MLKIDLNCINCADESYDAVELQLSENREDVFSKVTRTIAQAEKEDKDVYINVLEGPIQLKGKSLAIAQIVVDAKAVDPA